MTILQTRWGFDDRVQEQCFIPFSIYVRNEQQQPWTGTFSLKRTTRFNAPTGAVFESSVTLEPLESRWVQIFPFVRHEKDQWELTWFDGEERRVEVDTPFAGRLANVLITNDSLPMPDRGDFSTFPAECFPESLTGLDGLGVLFLDDVPQWSPKQTQAFLDWLTGGGQVVLLQNQEKQFPEFDERLSSMNRRVGQFQVGSGTVLRVTKQANELNRTQLEALPLRQSSHGIPVDLPAFISTHYEERYRWNRHQWILDILADHVVFERNWGLLSITVFLYFLLLFPVCYRLGYGQKNVKRFYIVFSSGVVLFSVIFWMLGQLGAGAQSRIANAVLAKRIGSGRFDVTTWSQLASVSGGTETLRSPGEGLCYTYPENQEQLPGLFRNGEQGIAEIRFRPASSVALLHRAVQVQDRPDPTLLNLTTDGPVLSDVAISVKDSFELPPKLGMVIHNEIIYPLSLRGDEFILAPNTKPTLLWNDLQATRHRQSSQFRWDPFAQKDSPKVDSLRGKDENNLAHILIGNAMGFDDQIDSQLLSASRRSLRLAVVTASPKSFQIPSTSFTDQEGTVLWVYDFPL